MIKGYLYGIDGRQEGGQAALRAWNGTPERSVDPGRLRVRRAHHADGLVIACPESGDVVLIEPSPDGYKELARAAVLDGRSGRWPPLPAAGCSCGTASGWWPCKSVRSDGVYSSMRRWRVASWSRPLKLSERNLPKSSVASAARSGSSASCFFRSRRRCLLPARLSVRLSFRQFALSRIGRHFRTPL